uniref:Uncharacterized protein n=1 Tax=Glossina pallidipes TaxID=7398 RepID=A0A1B0ADU5_GLOPL
MLLMCLLIYGTNSEIIPDTSTTAKMTHESNKSVGLVTKESIENSLRYYFITDYPSYIPENHYIKPGDLVAVKKIASKTLKVKNADDMNNVHKKSAIDCRLMSQDFKQVKANQTEMIVKS